MSTTNIPVADIIGMPTPIGQPSGLVLATNGAGAFQLVSAGSGNVTAQGTPVLNQLTGWVNSTTIQGLTLGTNLSITGTTLNATGGGLTNPMTTTGDIIYSSSGTGTPARLGIGSTSSVLQVIGGIPAWSTFLSLPSTPNSVNTTTGMITYNYPGYGVAPALSFYGGNTFIGGAGSNTYPTTGAGLSIAIGVGGAGTLNSLTSITGDDTQGTVVIGAYSANGYTSLPSSTPSVIIGASNVSLAVNGAGNSAGNVIVGAQNIQSHLSSTGTLNANVILGSTNGSGGTGPFTQNVFLGNAIGSAYWTSGSMTGNVVIGHSAGNHMNSNTNCVYIGFNAAEGTPTNTTINNAIAIGPYAGAFGSASNTLFIGNFNQGTAAGDQNYSLIYGTFAGAAGTLTGQTLKVNGVFSATSIQSTPIGSTTASTGAFTTLSATGLFAALAGVIVNTGTQSSSYTLGSTDTNVAFTGSSAASWAMPASPTAGTFYIVSNMGTAVLTVTSSNNFFTSIPSQPSITLNPGDVAQLIYINSTWKVS